MITIEFETNYNNKLFCDHFVHIAQAPRKPVTEHKLLDPIKIEILDTPNLSVQVMLVDICRLSLSQLLNIHTLPSHGLMYYDFIEWWQLKYPSFNAPEYPLAVYYYKRIKDKSEG